MKAKEIILLILIIAAGVFFYHAHTGKIFLDFDWGNGIFFSYDEFSYEESEIIEPSLFKELLVNNRHGDVEIYGTEDERITISLQKIIWRKEEEAAKKIADALKIVIEKNGQSLSVSTNRNEFRRKNFETHFNISVPASMDVNVRNSYGLVRVSKSAKTHIDNRHGKVIVSDLEGELTLQNTYEDIEVENVKSNCLIDTLHADVNVNLVKGNVKLIHRYGKLHLENISGEVTVEGSHTEVFGQNIEGLTDIVSSYEHIALFDVGPVKIRGNQSQIEMDGAKGDVEITNRYSKVNLENIQGNLEIDGKNLGVYCESIVGNEISISSTYNDIELTEFSGQTTILLSNGDIHLEPSPLTHPIVVKGEYADIILYWPPGRKYPIEAKAKGGDIKWNVPYELSLQEDNGYSVIKAFVEETENPSISLSTTYRTIRIEEKPLI